MHFLLVVALILHTLRAVDHQEPPNDNQSIQYPPSSNSSEYVTITPTRPATTEIITATTNTTKPAHKYRRLTYSMCTSDARCFRDVNCDSVKKQPHMIYFYSPVMEEPISACALVIIYFDAEGTQGRKIDIQSPYDDILRVDWTDNIDRQIEFNPIKGTVTCMPRSLCSVQKIEVIISKENNDDMHFATAWIRMSIPREKVAAQTDSDTTEEPKKDESQLVTIIVYCVIGILIAAGIAIVAIAMVQRRLDKRAGRIRELASQGSKGSGSISGAALAHKLSDERVHLVATPKAPTPKAEMTPKLAKSQTRSIIDDSVSQTLGPSSQGKTPHPDIAPE